jgi:hypothetical protein
LRRGLSSALASLGWLAICIGSNAQVTVDTIGGGVRRECQPSYGFASGNSFENAQFNAPYSCALDTNGNLWIADKNNSDLEQVSQAGNLTDSVTTEYYTISGTSPHIVTNLHSYTNITGVAVDPGNNLYVLLPSPPAVVKYNLTAQSASLNELSTLLLTGAPAGVAATAMAVDAHSNVFLAFTNGVIIRFQLLDKTPAPTIYSESYALGASPAVHYVVTGFNWHPSGLALLPDGQLAVSDTLSNAIYVVSTNDYTANEGPQLLTGANGAGYDDGPPEFAQFDQPIGMVASADGRLVVCDMMNNRVRVIDTSAQTSTLYGTDSSIWPETCCSCDPARYAGWVDGEAGTATNSASSREPISVTIGPGGSLFVTEGYYSLIRQVTNTDFTAFNSSATVPVAVTLPATAVNSTNATLNGTVNPGDASASYFFEWGATTNYGNYTLTNVLATKLTIAQAVSMTVSNLSPGTTYHFQLVAYNGAGYSFGGDATVFTLAAAPLVTTLPATGITSDAAVLNADVDPDYSATTAYFQWGTSTNFGELTTPTNLNTDLTADQPVAWTLNGLQPGTIYYYRAVGFNSGGTAFGNILVFNTQLIPPPTLSFTPSNGYFPECVTITVTSSAPLVYFTTDGSTPTTNSAEVIMAPSDGGFVGSLQWCNPQQDLSALHVIAVNGPNTTVVQGILPSTNLIGFPQSLSGGTGGHLYIPVVVEFQSNAALESVQFRVEVNPNGSAPTMAPLDLQPLTTNDFVLLPGPSPKDAPVTFDTFTYTTASNGQGLLITASGESSGLEMQSAGVVVMLHLQIPTTAAFGQSYSLSVLDPSGTSDGVRATLGLTTLPTQTLTVLDPAYMVGDSTPSYGYNAGQFGQGSLDNADVNNAIYASVGIRVPPSDSDAYNSMDSWPPDSAGRGGDGFIRLLDWETILARSLGGVLIYPGLDTNNYVRFWTNGDNGFPSHAVVDWEPGGPPVTLSLDSDAASAGAPAEKLSLSNAPPGLIWFCQASVGSGTIINAQPGNTVALPVYANVLPGYSLAALQFRSIVTGSSGAPGVTAIQFIPAPGVPSPLVLPGLSGNDTVQAWSFGSFAAPLQKSNYLGTISFQIPLGAGAGANYELHFVGVDGAPGNTAYQMDSHPGYVWVMSAAPQPASITSDEWKLAFFGSLTNSQAADNVDADGDGALNWQEYVAGTNPTNALSRLQFTSASFYTNGAPGVAINWLTAPGKNYSLLASPALTGAAWTPINSSTGDGNEYQFIDTNFGGGARFYQIEIQP